MSRIIAISLCLAVAFCLVAPLPVASGDVIYVHSEPQGTGNDGTSWEDAFLVLTDALAIAEEGDEVWVAAGTYLPTGTQTTGSRSATFEIPSGVKVYGAFAGGEASLDRRPEPSAILEGDNLTILDGDINIPRDYPCDPEFESCPDPVADNVFHVVTAVDADCETVLDGFTIRNGNASDPGDDSHGGGLFASGSALQIRNCTFTANQAAKGGGGAYVGGLPVTLDLVFIMDTSDSMEDEAAAICDSMQHLVAKLELQGFRVNPHFLGITEIPMASGFSCLEDTVSDLLGTTVPDPSTCGEDLEPPSSPSSDHAENWAPATAIVADDWAWTTNAVRLIVPVSDEAPCLGDAFGEVLCDEHDEAAIQAAAYVAQQRGVIVSPILGTGTIAVDDCALLLAESLYENH